MRNLAKNFNRLSIFNRLVALKHSNDISKNNMNNMKICCKLALKEILMFVCNFCELFLLIFILLYVFYENVIIIFFILAGILGILYNLQDSFVYHPEEPPESKYYIEHPSLYNLPYENVELITSDKLRLHSYLLKQPSNICNTAPTLVCFHGNAGNIGQRLSNAHCFYSYCQCNVFLVEYRGYGLSEGQASEFGFYKDGEAAINHLFKRSDIDTNKIIIFGQSIGGAVAIELALKFNDKLMGFMVENTFTSLPDIGRELFSGIPGVQYLPDFCFKNQYQSVLKCKFITLPGLFISGQADSMIPPRMMKLLFDKSNCSIKRLLKLEEGNHNNTWLCPGYFQFINKFIQEITTARNSDSQAQSNMINIQVWQVNSR